MKTFVFTLIFSLSFFSMAGSNVEIKGTYKKHNKNYIYLDSEEASYKLIRSELTKEGVAQILKNKEIELTLFVPKKSIKSEKIKPQKKEK